MKFGKLTLVVGAMMLASALMQAEIKLKINKETVAIQSKDEAPWLSIKIDKNKGFCYEQPGTGGNQICNENDIALDSLKNPEDYFNFDKWYEPGKLFNKIETIQWQETSYTVQDQPDVYTCQAIVEDGYNKFTREKAPDAQVEFSKECKIRIFNPKSGKYMPTSSFLFDEKSGEWKFVSTTTKMAKA